MTAIPGSIPTISQTAAPGLQAPVEVQIPRQMLEEVEVSFVMPCLNEAQTIEGCVNAAMKCIRENNLRGEVVIGDNGSTDGSQEIANRAGARVIAVPKKGYGNALMGGIDAARGKYIIMGDSDMSYDFGEGMKFVERMRQGFDLVMGNRFDRRGGGGVQPGAMPFKNRYLGNPVLSWVGRILFNVPARDFHCGLRAFSKDAFSRMNVRTPGMEFASEIVIKATLQDMRIGEVPIKLWPDGRNRPPHLRPWRDGWRHLRYMMCLSPRWTLFIPGILLLAFGLLVGAIVALNPIIVGGVAFDVHTLVAASLATIIGYQWCVAAVLMRVYGLHREIGPPSAGLNRLSNTFNLERGLIAGLAMCAAGLIPMLWVVWHWYQSGFGPLDVQVTLRPMVIGATVIAVGVQTVLAALVFGMLQIRRQLH